MDNVTLEPAQLPWWCALGEDVHYNGRWIGSIWFSQSRGAWHNTATDRPFVSKKDAVEDLVRRKGGF